MATTTKGGKADARAARKARLAAALRENLKRRKHQARQRAGIAQRLRAEVSSENEQQTKPKVGAPDFRRNQGGE